MTQRVFDVENEKDMQDLWDILPDGVEKITLEDLDTMFYGYGLGFQGSIVGKLININWHDKTEITRPMQEATKEDIGKLCVFWNSEYFDHYGILDSIKDGYYFDQNGRNYSHCRRLTEQEIEKLKEYERIVTSYNMKPIDYDIACETVNKLLDEKKFLKEEISAYKRRVAELKELLKEVLRHELSLKEVSELTRKIGEALGEE